MRNALLSLLLVAAAGCSLMIDPDGVKPVHLVTSIAVTPATTTLPIGASQQLTVIATYTDASTGDVSSQATWTTGDATVATVSGTGMVTSVAPSGSAIITATFQGKNATATVTAAAKAVASILVTPATTTLPKGATQQLSATATYTDSTTGDVTSTATWTTSNASAATVSTAGLVTGAGTSGTATVTATLQGKSGTAAITAAAAAVVSIAVTPATATLPKGTTQQLTATATYTDTTTGDVTSSATWTTSNASAATVSTVGLVSGAGASGTATITAAFSGKSGTATVTAAPAAVVSIAVTPASTTLPKGTTQQLTATATYTDTTTGDATSSATWTTSNGSAATVSSTGLATATGASGTATITASLSGKSGTATITAAAATLSSIAVTPATASVPSGATQQLTATATWSDASTTNVTTSASWTSDNGAVATVGATTGLVTAVASSGTAVIAATYGGKTATSMITATAAISSIAVTPATATVPKGATQQLTATATWADSTTSDVTAQATWTTSNAAVATVSTGGVVTAAASAGTATITATFLGKTSTSTITAAAASIASIAVTPATATVPKGATQQLTATATYTDSTTADVTSTATWASGTTAVATVSSTGLVTAVAASGTATISATSGGKTGSATVTAAAAAIASIAVTPASSTLAKGTTQQLTATATYTDATTGNVTSTATWSSSSAAVATVSSGGLVTATGSSGTATITATAGGKSGTASVTASPATIVSIAVTPATATVPKGATQQLTATATWTDSSTSDVTASASWTSSSTSVATVGGATGLVTGVGTSGTTTITATLGGKSGTSTITGAPPAVASIAVAPASPAIAVGGTVQLTATATYTDGSSLDATTLATWSDSGLGIVSVSNTVGSQGLVTGLQAGTGVVSAAFGGKSGSASVLVKAVSSIAVTPATSTVPKGMTQQLTATATFSDSTTGDVTSQATWASGNASVATVSSTGVVTAVAGAGSASISASIGGKTGSATVTAAPAAVVSIAVTPATATVPKGTTQQLTATATYTDATTGDVSSTATWTSGTTTVATVSTTGLVTAAASSGTSIITATLSGKSGTATITAAPPTVVSIAVTPSTASVAKGLTQQFTATATYSDSSTGVVTSTAAWTSSVTSVATISSAGLATTVGQGSTTITAFLSLKSGTATLTVTAPTLVSIAVTPSPLTLPQGAHAQLTATGTYTDSSTQDLTAQATWSSTAPTFATVGTGTADKGMVRALSQGTTTISASWGGKTGTASVTVGPVALVRIDLLQYPPTNSPGSGPTYSPPEPLQTTMPVTATPVRAVAQGTWSDGRISDLTAVATWASTNTSALTVSNDAVTRGYATAIAAGTSTLSATWSGITASKVVTVRAPLIVWVAPFPGGMALPVGATASMTAKALLDDWSVTDITATATWTSSVAGVATVAAGGQVTGVGAGSALITATAGGVSGDAALLVSTATLSSYSIWPPNPTAYLDYWNISLSAVAAYSDGSTLDVTHGSSWASSAPAVATVDWEGEVTAYQTGSATVTATFNASPSTPKPTATTTLTVVTGMVNIWSPPPLPLGAKVQLHATARRSDGTVVDLTNQATWSSSTPTVADFLGTDPKGMITASTTTQGGTDVIATIGLQQYHAWVNVTGATVTKIDVTPTPITMPVGASIALTATVVYSDATSSYANGSVTWTSSNTSMVALHPTSIGTINAVGAGTPVVSASLFGVTGTASVTVKASPVASIVVSPASATVAPMVGNTSFTASATLQDGTPIDVTAMARWSSTDPNIAGGGGGNFTGMNPGTTQVVAALGNAVGTATLVVSPQLWLSQGITTLWTGTKDQVRAWYQGPGGTYLDATESATWTSSNPAIATVSDTAGTKGLVTGGSTAGAATITASYKGVQATVTYDVQSGTITSVYLSPSPISLGIGGSVTAQLHAKVTTATFDPVVNSGATWTSSAPGVALLSSRPGAAGQVYGVSAGSSTITATYPGFPPATATVTVAAPALTSTTVSRLYGSMPGGGCMGGALETFPTGLDARYAACAAYDSGRTYDVTGVATWSSTAPLVATVSDVAGSKGLVSTIAPGSAAVNAKISALPTGTGTGSITVTSDSLSWIQIEPEPALIHAGSYGTMMGQAWFTNGQPWSISSVGTWTFSNPIVATIGGPAAGGGIRVDGLSAGATAVKLAYKNKSTTVSLDVDGRSYVTLRPWIQGTSPVPAGLPLRVELSGVDPVGMSWDATESASWTSTNPAAATVSSAAGTRGRVTGVAPGFTTILATQDGITGSVDVEVNAATLVSVSIVGDGTSEAFDAGPVGVNLPTLRAWAKYSDGSQYDVTTYATWAGGGSVASSSGSGTFKITGTGSATVTATFNGATGTATVTGF